ncbi:MAG: LysR family transcriptional regulator [Acidimicrobiales bacterium]|nr:LysR family transcriptional regulator [Acidimicrobiales bacterium]
MELTLQHLRLLREVARRSTITAAADSLGYTRSAVSQQLMGLEKSTGVAVLERVGRGVRLTDAGRELVRHADEVLDGMEAAQAALEAVATSVRGTLVIGIYESVAATLLAPLVERLAIDHPDLRVRSRELDPDDAFDAVGHGDVDLAFTLDYPHDPVPRPDDIAKTSIAEESFLAVLPASVRAKDVIDLATLAECQFVAPNPSSACGRAVMIACRDAGFEPDVAHQVDGYPATLDLVAAGCGVALVPERSVLPRPGTHAARLARPVTRTIEVSHRVSSADRPMIRAAIDTLLDLTR